MTDQLENNEKICGIIRPIAKMNDFYTFEHWNSVKDIMERAIQKAGYTPLTVSDSKGSTTIHSSIFLNLYQNEIVVCDVSNRNANVMFELGMRIAFDKPVVIIKDDKTPFSFDTSHIKHLEYPSDLRFQVIEKFIDDLAQAIKDTVQTSKQPEYKSFLSHYAPIKVASLEVNEVSEKIALESILNSINNLEEKVNNLNNFSFGNKYINSLGLDTFTTKSQRNNNFIAFSFDEPLKLDVRNNILADLQLVEGVTTIEIDSDTVHIKLAPNLNYNKSEKIREKIKEIFKKNNLD
ncbi:MULTISPECIES: hypothetical protein [Acinetobacter calcoaceticus/baumannii complex]|uniref:hypothetical protein n=1 Tax=Acinetobacter calcoaceticus/baumannii complex TaxID=909768 RepID=UPI00168AB80E|nr:MULTISPECIES: hypothetical protein [Acinetobacter calcoaceticus/baumannii complex]MDH2651871.1 hypothetical protein [Acinetobacter baumannii]QNW92992.1 hypothetical protein IC799_08625 [Acinetobacter seifertii]